jgi:hypothetical protein
MQSSPVPDLAFSTVWRSVLDRMEQALARVETEAAAREAGLEATPALPLPDPEKMIGLVQILAPVEGWLEPVQASLRRAELLVAETAAVLQTEEETLRGWIACVESTRQRFEDFAKKNPQRGDI